MANDCWTMGCQPSLDIIVQSDVTQILLKKKG